MVSVMNRIMVVFLLLISAGLGQDGGEANAFLVAGKVTGAGDQSLDVALWDALAPGRFLAKGKTDGTGGFSLGIPQSTAERREHPFGAVVVVVKGAGFAERRVRAAAGSMTVAVALRVARKFSGLVESASGKPLPAAVVYGRKDGVIEKTTTDENGRFVLVQFDQAPAIEVVGEGCRVRVRDPARTTMPAVRMVAGVLTDVVGKPLAGARIRDGARTVAVTDDAGGYKVAVAAAGAGVVAARYRVFLKGYEAAWLGDPVHAVEPLAVRVVVGDKNKPVKNARVSIGADFVQWTDEFGTVRFDTLPRGMVVLRAEAPGLLPAEVRVEAGIAADRMTLRLIEGAEFEGKVLKDGKPVLGARVTAGSATAFSGSDGIFLLRGVPDGAVAYAIAPGARSKLTRPRDGMTLVLWSKMELSGRLMSDTGAPLGGVEIECSTPDRDEPLIATSAANGTFSFGKLPIRHYMLLAAPENHVALATSMIPGDPAVLTAKSRLGHRELHIRAVVESGAETTIEIRRLDAPMLRRLHKGSSASFQGLPGGRYEVRIRAELHLDDTFVVDLDKSRYNSIRRTLKRGGTLDLVTNPGAKVIVQTLSGKPAPIIVMELSTGKKSVRGFGPGKYRFIARAKGELIVVRNLELGPNAPPKTLDLRGGKAATLTVKVDDGADPVVGAVITIESNGFVSPRPARTDENGVATIKRLFDGRITVRVKKGESEISREVDVEPGTGMSLELTVR